ncbi:MAG: hypothetical protein JWM10_2230 [Myxococcaceae bacterium]|nr:hypothetical protein [Myxococcaceae bacterium]
MARHSTGAAGALLIVGASIAASVATTSFTARPAPSASATTTVVRATPNVLRSVQELARLESVTFHMERVIDLRDEQEHAFGLVHAEDSILLVAVGEVIAGVDLAALRPEDVTVDAVAHRAVLTLPSPTVFSARLDGARTHVHSRSTDVMARRSESLETRARAEAERSIAQGALEAGILDRAKTSAAHTVGSLVRALGYNEVEIRWR